MHDFPCWISTRYRDPGFNPEPKKELQHLPISIQYSVTWLVHHVHLKIVEWISHQNHSKSTRFVGFPSPIRAKSRLQSRWSSDGSTWCWPSWGPRGFWGFWMIAIYYPLVMTNIAMENPPINGKIIKWNMGWYHYSWIWNDFGTHFRMPHVFYVKVIARRKINILMMFDLRLPRFLKALSLHTEKPKVSQRFHAEAAAISWGNSLKISRAPWPLHPCWWYTQKNRRFPNMDNEPKWIWTHKIENRGQWLMLEPEVQGSVFIYKYNYTLGYYYVYTMVVSEWQSAGRS